MLPFTSYDNLIANVQETLNRADLAAAVPGFIALVEGDVNADDRFRVLPSLKRSTATLPPPTPPATESYIPMPADYICMQNFHLIQTPPPNRLELLTTTQADEMRLILPEQDLPQFFVVTGEEFELLPAPDISYQAQMTYFANVPPLSTSNETNWLLQRWPNVYYYGALRHSAPYLKDDARIAVWNEFYNQIAENIHISSDRGQFSGQTMKMRVLKRYR